MVTIKWSPANIKRIKWQMSLSMTCQFKRLKFQFLRCKISARIDSAALNSCEFSPWYHFKLSSFPHETHLILVCSFKIFHSILLFALHVMFCGLRLNSTVTLYFTTLTQLTSFYASLWLANFVCKAERFNILTLSSTKVSKQWTRLWSEVRTISR